MEVDRNILRQSLMLPCGASLSNRLGGAALTEHLAGEDGLPNALHFMLYKTWAQSGAAFKFTGNVMVDRRSLEGKGNVILEEGQPVLPFEQWAQTASNGLTQLWMQLGHAGGLSPCPESLSPSGVQHSGIRVFPKPRVMTYKDISDVIRRFRYAARLTKDVGFTGVEIHSAHGFLLNQFLSPATNKRTDEWGGSLKNRMRLLLEVVRQVRDAVGPAFPVAVKLSATDGIGIDPAESWTEEESVETARALAVEGIDLLETSGGNYDRPIMLGSAPPPQGDRPEAFFADYARKVRQAAPTLPIMLTAGMRSVSSMATNLRTAAADVIGLGRPLAALPNIPLRILSGQLSTVPPLPGEQLAVFDQLQWFQACMRRIAMDHGASDVGH